jgi:hypothetical protein
MSILEIKLEGEYATVQFARRRVEELKNYINDIESGFSATTASAYKIQRFSEKHDSAAGLLRYWRKRFDFLARGAGVGRP